MSTDKEDKLEREQKEAYLQLKGVLGTSWDHTTREFISKVESLANEHSLTKEELHQAVTLIVYYL